MGNALNTETRRDDDAGCDVLHLFCSHQASKLAGLQAHAVFTPNTASSSMGAVVQNMSCAIILNSPKSIHRARLDVETDFRTCSRAAAEGSYQLNSNNVASATVGCAITQLHHLLNNLQLIKMQHQQQCGGSEPSDGLSWGAAAARKVNKRCKLQARLFAARSIGTQLLVEAVQQVGQQHLLQVTCCSVRQQQPGVGPTGSTWVECSVSAARRPAKALELAPAPATTEQQDQQQQQQQAAVVQQQWQQPVDYTSQVKRLGQTDTVTIAPILGQQHEQQQQQQVHNEGAAAVLHHQPSIDASFYCSSSAAGASSRHGRGSKQHAGEYSTLQPSTTNGLCALLAKEHWPQSVTVQQQLQLQQQAQQLPNEPQQQFASGPEARQWTLSCGCDPWGPQLRWCLKFAVHNGVV